MSALGTDLTIPDQINGPAEIGLAAIAGDRDLAADKLQVYSTLVDTLNRLPEVAGLSAANQRWYYIAASVVWHRKWYLYGEDVDGNAHVHGTLPGAAAGGTAFVANQAFVDSITAAEVSLVSLIMLATKVNMWQINHHTGQGAIVGYSRKALSLVLGITTEPPADVVRMMWVIGHWVSTKAAWTAFGVTHLANPAHGVHDAATWPNPTTDIRIRMEAGPAGAAKAMTHKAIVQFAKRSAYSMMLPADAAYAQLVGLPAVCIDARNHDGALHFTGAAKQNLYDVPDPTIEALGAYIHAVAPKSSLAKAKVIARLEQVKGSDVYVRISNAIASIKAAGSAKEEVARLRLMIGVSASSDPFAGVYAALGETARVIPSDDDVDEVVEAMNLKEAAAAAAAK